MSKTAVVELFTHEAMNPYSGEYTNSLYGRKLKNGTFTLWVWCQGDWGTKRDCWQKNIRTPKQFVDGCFACFEFVDFNYACQDEIYESVLPVLEQLDEGFAKKVRTYLEENFCPDGFPEEGESEPLESEYFTCRRLSPEEAIKKYGAGFTIIGNFDPSTSQKSEEESAEEKT